MTKPPPLTDDIEHLFKSTLSFVYLCWRRVHSNLFFSEKNVYYLFTWLHWVLVVAGGIFNWGTRDLSQIEPGPSALGAQSLSCRTTWEVPHLFFLILLFIYGCAGSSLLLLGFSLVEASRGYLLSLLVVLTLLTGVASLIVEHGLLGVRASIVAARSPSSCGSWALGHRLNSCGTRASLLRGVWNLPGPGFEPVSPALVDDSSRLSLQGSPQFVLFNSDIYLFVVEFQVFFMYLKHFYPSPFIYVVQFSCSAMSDSLQPHESQHARPPCPSPTPGVPSNSCPSSRWCHPAISSSVIPFSFCPQSLPASESFPMSQLTWGGQSTGVSALESFLPKNTQDWSPLEWTYWISLDLSYLHSTS